MVPTLANEEENKKKSMRISIGLHLLLLLIAFFYVMPVPNPKPKPYAVEVKFAFAKSSLSNYAKSDPGKARAKTKKVESVETKVNKPIEVKKPEIKREQKPKVVETKPTEPIITETVEEESPIEAVEEDIEIEDPIPEEIYEEEPEEVAEEVYEEELEEVPEEVFTKPTTNTDPSEEVAEADNGGAQDSRNDGKADGPPSDINGEEGGSGKSNDGDSAGASSGNDGDEGKADGGAGQGEFDDSGDGVFGRMVKKRNHKEVLSVGLTTGKTVMKICINRAGNVTYAELLESSETDRTKKRKILKAAYGYKYEPDPSAPEEQCGKLTIDATINALQGF